MPLQAFKTSSHCKRHVTTCRAKEKKQKSESDAEESDNDAAIFSLTVEQFDRHRMKNCSVFTRRLQSSIEDAVNVATTHRLTCKRFLTLKLFIARKIFYILKLYLCN